MNGENTCYKQSVTAVVLRDNKVLLARHTYGAGKDFLIVPGGYLNLDETPEQAVKREVLEETGVEYEIDRLAVIHENFFNENQGSLKGMDCHEISMYYLMKPRGTKQLNSDSYSQGVRETMHWILIKDLDKYKAFPTFLKEYFSKEHSGVEHIITDERK